MQITKDIVIKIKEVLNSELAVLHTDGDAVWGEMCKAWWDPQTRLRKNTRAVLNFEGLERVGFHFLNATIGRVCLHNSLNPDYDISCINTGKVFDLEEKIELVLSNAKLQSKFDHIKFVLENGPSFIKAKS